MAGDNDEVHDKKPQCYAEDNRAVFNCTQWKKVKPWSQLNSTGWVESDRVLWSQPATHLNSTGPVVTSSAILNIGCVSSDHIARRDVITL